MADSSSRGDALDKIEKFARLLKRQYLRSVDINEYIDMERHEIREALEEMKARGYDAEHFNIASPREDPYTYHAEFLLDQILLRIEMLRGELTLPAKPHTAMIVSPQVNAMSIRVPDTSSYILAIDASLMSFCYSVAKVFVVATGIKFVGSTPQIVVNIPADNSQFGPSCGPSPAEWLFTILQGYAVLRAPTIGLPIPLDKDQGTFIALLTGGMETFIIGHEYGHIALGHLDGPGMRTVRFRDGFDVDIIDHPWKDELLADQYGFVLGSKAILFRPAQEFFCNYLGGYLTLVMFDMMDRAISILGTGNEETLAVESHPPAEFRMAAYRSTALQMGVSEGSYTYAMLDNIDTVNRLLWPSVRDLLLAAHHKGIRPHQDWSPRPR